MKKFTFITISLSLLFMFAGCSDSGHVLSPANELSPGGGEQDGTLSKSAAESTATLQLEPIGSATQWRLEAQIASNSNGQSSCSGKFEIILRGGIIMVPVLGVMQMENNSSGGVDIDLQVQGQEPGGGQVQLSFQGSGLWNSETGIMSGIGNVFGIFSNIPELQISLNGPGQITIPDETGAQAAQMIPPFD